MANKLVIYKIEDQDTGKMYQIEGPEGATADELGEFLLSQQQTTPAQSAEPSVASPVTPPSPERDFPEQPLVGRSGFDQMAEGSKPRPFSPEEEVEYLDLAKNPAITTDQIGEFFTRTGHPFGGPTERSQFEAERAKYLQAIAEGKPVSDEVGYRDRVADNLDPYVQTEDPDLGNLGAALEEGMAYNPIGILARVYKDWTDAELEGGVSKDVLRKQYPDLSDEAIEDLHDDFIGEFRRRELLNASGQLENRDVNFLTRIAGSLVGGASPIDFIPLGRGVSLGGRLAEGAASNAIADVALQASDVAYGAQGDYNFGQTAQAGLEGAALQGAIEGVSRAAGFIASTVDRKLNTGSVDTAQAPVATSELAITIPSARKNSKAYKEQVKTAGVDIVDRINAIIAGWKNAPEFEVHDNFKAIDGVDNDAIGVITPDGKVMLNTENILSEAKRTKSTPEDVISAVIYHEALGHYGLAQKFGDKLESVLSDFYTNSVTSFKDKVDKWLEDNPKEYLNVPNRQLRAAEEVLAEMSEQGRIPVTILNRITNIVKDLARQMGLNLRYSEREIASILGMAHNAVVNGKGRDVSGNGFRYMTTYHGSPYDFDAFDHSKIGLGEGAQAFGWGTYLTESENLARIYKNKLENVEYSWSGVKGNAYQTRNNALKDVKDRGLDEATANDVINDIQTGGDGRLVDNKYWDTKLDQATQDFVIDKYKIKGTGKLYEVDVPDDAKFLEWDKPLNEQPEVIESLKDSGYKIVSPDEFLDAQIPSDKAYAKWRNAEAMLNDEWGTPGLTSKEEVEYLKSDYDAKIKEALTYIDEYSSGEDLYRQLVNDLGSQKQASDFLKQGGLSGTKYLDGFSRDRGEGTYNYVIYDDKTPKIVNKYMKKKTRELSEEERITNAREILSGALENYTPEIRTWAEGKRAARDRGLTAKQIKGAKSIGELDKRLFQYDAVADMTDQKLVELHEKMNNGTFNLRDKQKYLETIFSYNELLARIFDDQAEIGRALNAMKALTFTKKRVTEINEILGQFEGNNIAAFADEDVFNRFVKQIQGLMESGNPDGAHSLMRSVMKPYWWQYVLSFRHSMMLSGLGTHAKNAYDNAGMIVRELEEMAVATPGFVIRKGLRAAGVNVQEGVSPQEIGARMYALLRTALDANTYKDAAAAFNKGHENRQYSSKIEMQDARIPILSKVQDILHATDTFFRSFHENANLYTLGVRKAREEGFTGLAAFEEGSNIAMTANQKMKDEAKAMADIPLLVDKPSFISAKLEATKAVRPGMKGFEQAGVAFANFLLPFFRVTDRLLFQKIRRLGPVALLDRVTREDIAAGGPRMDIALGRMALSSALIWYYWNQAGEGNIEGAGPQDPDKLAALQAGGYLPNSVKTDDQYTDATALNLSLLPDNLQNSLAANIATIREAYESGLQDTESTAQAVALATRSLLTELSSTSFAENLSTYLEPFQEGQEWEKDSATANMLAGSASQFLPALMRQYNQIVNDPVKRDTAGDKTIPDKVKGRLMSAIPGLSDNLPVKYDVYGDPMEQGRSWSAIDNYQKIKQDKVSQELQRLERTTDEAVVVGAPSSFQYEGEKIKLTADGKQEWQRVQGHYIKLGMSQAIGTDEWKQAADADKIAIVKEVRKEAYDLTKEYMLPLLGITPEEEEE